MSLQIFLLSIEQIGFFIKMTNISRRTLAKGSAWALPSVIATTQIPAYAASQCPEPVLIPASSVDYYWGMISNVVRPRGTTTQYLYSSAGFQITGLPLGVTVEKATYTQWIETRQPGSRMPGAFWPGDTSGASFSNDGICSGDSCNFVYSGNSMAPGWDRLVTSHGPTPHTFPADPGTPRTGWNIEYTFDGSSGAGTYQGSSQCGVTFISGRTGPLASQTRPPLVATYPGVPMLGRNDMPHIYYHTHVEVTLSNGQVLTADRSQRGATR